MLQAFAKPDLALARKYQVQYFCHPHREQTFFLLYLPWGVLCVVLSPVPSDIPVKVNCFQLQPPAFYS